MQSSSFDVQGHRGCRGLLPENTIPAFLKAAELGVTTLEMDVVITADNQVLVSHEPYMSHEICLTPEGKSISEKEEKSYNIFKMTSETVSTYDCGSKEHPRFKEQAKMKLGKPLLKEVIDAVENYQEKNKKDIRYNIEIKCTREGDQIFHPHPETFCDLLLDVIRDKNIMARTTIQSFDTRTLKYIHSLQVPVQLSLLVENIKGITYNLDQLNFTPDIYSPYYRLVNSHNLHYLHQNKIKMIPWTINDTKTMQLFIAMGVDGIITDYPDKLLKLISEA